MSVKVSAMKDCTDTSRCMVYIFCLTKPSSTDSLDSMTDSPMIATPAKFGCCPVSPAPKKRGGHPVLTTPSPKNKPESDCPVLPSPKKALRYPYDQHAVCVAGVLKPVALHGFKR